MATLCVGVVGMEAAFAVYDLQVSPDTGLVDGEEVDITLSGFTGDPLASMQVAQCGNAYANLDPLPAIPSPAPNQLDMKNCEVIGFLPEGAMTTSPVDLQGLPLVTVRQNGIGTGNRACITATRASCTCRRVRT
jgi:hypothetical protein